MKENMLAIELLRPGCLNIFPAFMTPFDFSGVISQSSVSVMPRGLYVLFKLGYDAFQDFPCVDYLPSVFQRLGDVSRSLLS